MKKLVQLVIVLLAFQNVYSQYLPILNSNATWYESFDYDYGDGSYIATEYNRVFIKNDTILNGLLYQKLVTLNNKEITLQGLTYPPFTYESNVGLIREDNAAYFIKSYSVIDSTFIEERKIMDFNLVEGDTVTIARDCNNFFEGDFYNRIRLRVTSIDTLTIGGINRKVINLMEDSIQDSAAFSTFSYYNSSWIEGIGSMCGFIPTYYYYINGFFLNSSLECFYDSSFLYPENLTLEYCNTLQVEASNKSSNNVHVYPNPTTGNFYLETAGLDPSFNQLQILDVIGRIVYSDKFLSNQQLLTIPFDNQPSGVYFLSLFDANRVLITKKIVKE